MQNQTPGGARRKAGTPKGVPAAFCLFRKEKQPVLLEKQESFCKNKIAVQKEENPQY